METVTRTHPVLPKLAPAPVRLTFKAIKNGVYAVVLGGAIFGVHAIVQSIEANLVGLM